jgi:predicted DNA-binding transcriptional regulator YafY
MSEASQHQTERLNYLEFRVLFTGQIGRGDLMKRFGISEAAATRDLSRYREIAPDNLEFDSSTKTYRIGSRFTRSFLKDLESRQLLRALIQGMGDDFASNSGSMINCELPAEMHVLDTESLAAVCRAIYQKCALRIEYFSKSGNHGSREIVPFSLASTGLKWMVRAYCRRKQIFCDFVLNRIKTAEVLPRSFPAEHETREHDDEWNRFLKLELVPHPSASAEDRAKTEQEFRMSDGFYNLRVRASLAGFVLRLWSVDCSEDNKLSMLPLALRNRIVLHDVDSAKLAPGYLAQTKAV